MILRDLRTMNLVPFIESHFASHTMWPELSRTHGDALAQRSLLSSVSSFIKAQIQFYTTAKDMWVYITESYSDIAQIQFVGVLAEVDTLLLGSCSTVHEAFDKLIALCSAAAELGHSHLAANFKENLHNENILIFVISIRILIFVMIFQFVIKNDESFICKY